MSKKVAQLHSITQKRFANKKQHLNILREGLRKDYSQKNQSLKNTRKLNIPIWIGSSDMF